MIQTANRAVPEKGIFRHAVAAVGAWFQALDYTSFDYTQARIDLLEQKVAALTEELRASRAFSHHETAPQ
jgi:hypothetical protein